MKIANIILTSQNGGAEQVFIDYMITLKNLGHDLIAITKNDAPYAHKVSELNIPLEKTSNRLGYHDFFAVRKIQKILQDSKTDAVFAHAGRATVIARKAIKRIKNKKIFLISINHSMNVKRSIGSDVVLSVNKQIFFRTIDAGRSENSSFVISNIIDLDDAIFDAPKVDLSEKNIVTLGVIGRLDKVKGFYHVIHAMKKLTEISDKKFILKIAGAGYQEAFLRKLAKKLAVENSVEFCGWISDKKSFFNSIDIFILPSERETFGLVLLEAMKFRKPIISTRADGPKEILRDGIDALMIDANPLDGLRNRIAEAALQLIGDPSLVNNLIENSFARLQKKFSYESLEKALGELVGQGSSNQIKYL